MTSASTASIRELRNAIILQDPEHRREIMSMSLDDLFKSAEAQTQEQVQDQPSFTPETLTGEELSHGILAHLAQHEGFAEDMLTAFSQSGARTYYVRNLAVSYIEQNYEDGMAEMSINGHNVTVTFEGDNDIRLNWQESNIETHMSWSAIATGLISLGEDGAKRLLGVQEEKQQEQFPKMPKDEFDIPISENLRRDTDETENGQDQPEHEPAEEELREIADAVPEELRRGLDELIDIEKKAQMEEEQEAEQSEPEPKKTTFVRNNETQLTKNTLQHRNFREFAKLAPELVSGESKYMRFQAGEAIITLVAERLYGDRVSLAHYYEQNGDLISDPDIVFEMDTKEGTLSAREFQDYFGYTNVENEQGLISDPRRARELDSFAQNWFSNIRDQGYIKERIKVKFQEREIDLLYDIDGNGD